jgi:hypothetical protein
MTGLKTQRTDADVDTFLSGVPDPRRREDARAVVAMMREITGEEPAMWGTSIVGFGTIRYRNSTGKEAEWPAIGLSPRKQALTLYLMDGFEDRRDLLGRLGAHTTGKACLYVKRLDALDEGVLRELISASVAQVRAPDESGAE